MTTLTFELHALIDEARRRARLRRWIYGAVALLVGGGIWAALAFVNGSRATTPPPPAPPGYHVVQAQGTVQHALVSGLTRSSEAGRPVGNFASVNLDVWFDRDAGLIKSKGCWSNRCFPLQSRNCADYCPTAVDAVLFYPYWPVDTTKFVQRPGTDTFRGHNVIWIEKLQGMAAPGFQGNEWIALDSQTHDAVGYRLYDTTSAPDGVILNEFWIDKRFADVAPSRFWFALKDKGTH